MIKEKYQLAKQVDTRVDTSQSCNRDAVAYQATHMHEYGQEFLSYVDPYYVKDIEDNYEWYLQN